MWSLAVCLLLLSTVRGHLMCNQLHAPDFGRIKSRYTPDGLLQTMFSCDSTHRIKGHKVLTCNGYKWDHPVPMCVERGPKHWYREELFAGDEPYRERVSREVRRAEDDHSQSQDKSQTVMRRGAKDLRRRRRTQGERRKHGAKSRRKLGQEESLSKVAGAGKLNETLASQLDISCTKKNPKRKSIKAPSIEHANKPRYARSL